MITIITEKQALDLAGTPRVRIKGLVGKHNGVFHADDVFSCALLDITGGHLQFVSTRDPAVLDCCQLVLDVGGVHDPVSGRFDHHQPGGAGHRSNGVPYASFGLLWSHHGWAGMVIRSVGVGNGNLVGIEKLVDERLVQAIDAADCGYTAGVDSLNRIPRFSISEAVSSFNPTWLEEAAPGVFDARFIRAVEFARGVLIREIVQAAADMEAVDKVRSAIRSQRGQPDILELDRFCPWQETVVTEAPEIKFVVFPSETKDFRVQAVPDQIGSFGMRVKLPASWAGLRGADLALAVRTQGGTIGDTEAVFCHIGRFICGATSFEGAMQMARTAIEVAATHQEEKILEPA